jgi:nucleoside-diphosphate-sugar epimerase
MSASAKHVVLGGNGVIGRETVRALTSQGLATVSVGRSPSASPEAESIVADLLDPREVVRALESAGTAYLTAGLYYSAAAWEKEWPSIVENTIGACVAHGTHLVYFDNVYAYGKVTTPMTESTSIRPTSRKGQIRAAALQMLTDAARARGLVYTVGRSADFYGPGASNSVFNNFAIEKIAAGKDPVWLFNAHQPHSLTYTRDIGQSLVVLGTDQRARGRVWHLPTAAAL